MTEFTRNLATTIKHHGEEKGFEMLSDRFDQSNDPWFDCFYDLFHLCKHDDKYRHLIKFYLDVMMQIKLLKKIRISINYFDENFFLDSLPNEFCRTFADLFPLDQNYLIETFRREIYQTDIHSVKYKRILKMIATFRVQPFFQVEEILLPLVLSLKDQLIHIFTDNQAEVENELLVLLNGLYANGGKHIYSILRNQHGLNPNNLNQKALRRLAIRFWKKFGRGRSEQFPNLAPLQDRSTLFYLVATKYNSKDDEKTMSDEAWNEAIEDVVRNDRILIDILLDLIVQNNDGFALRFWMSKFGISPRTLSIPMRRCFDENQRPTRTSQFDKSKLFSIDSKNVKIVFVDSDKTLALLVNRLNDRETTMIGFDCEWKPGFRAENESKIKISILQIAFDDQIFIVDLLNEKNFGRDEKLADSIFNQNQLTVLGYGIQSDISMLSEYSPAFCNALKDRKSLLDLALVHSDLTKIRKLPFPFDEQTKNSKGLSGFVQLCFGKILNKSEQCSDWERRPLRENQILYAATDAWCLLSIYRYLESRADIPTGYVDSFRGQKPTTSDEKSSSIPTDI